MAKRLKRRRQTIHPIADPYCHLAADIIIEAVMLVIGQAAGNDYDRARALLFLQSEKCRRWAGVVGVNWEAAMKELERQL